MKNLFYVVWTDEYGTHTWTRNDWQRADFTAAYLSVVHGRAELTSPDGTKTVYENGEEVVS